MNKNNLKWQLPFLVLLIVGTVLILRKQSPYQTDQGLVFGTVYKITYQSSENLKEEIEKELQKVDNSLSPFNKQSVITRINHNTNMHADSLFVYVFNMAKEISNETGKAYDVTVAPLVNAWGFGFKHSQFPDSLTIDSLRQFVGIDKVQLNAEGEVVKADPRMMLDFSSIAKGFGVDCVARLFDRKGIKNYMIDIGGELVLKGQNSKMETWRIGVNKPIDDSLSVNQEDAAYKVDHSSPYAQNVGYDTYGFRSRQLPQLLLQRRKEVCTYHRPSHRISGTAQYSFIYRHREGLCHSRCLRYCLHGTGTGFSQGHLQCPS